MGIAERLRRNATQRTNIAFVLLATVGLVISSCEGMRSADLARGGDPGDPVARLVGTSPERLTQVLGRPDFSRNDGPAAMWRYDADDCFLDVFFYREASGLRVNHVEARPRAATASAAPATATPNACYGRVAATRRARPVG